MLKCVVIPLKGREISGILANNKRISQETTLCLNKREILKCMKNASVYGIRSDGTKVLLTDSDSINKEIMDKVKDKQSHEQLLDVVGINNTQKKNIEESIQPYRYNNNRNQRSNKNTKNK